MIREGEKFSYCVEYLDNLHPNRKLEQEVKNRERKRKRLEKELEEANEEFTDDAIERYSY